MNEKEKIIKPVRLTEKGVRQLIKMMENPKPAGKDTPLYKGLEEIRKHYNTDK